MNQNSQNIGMVSMTVGDTWMGGRYYLQHLIRAVATLPRADQHAIVDVAWREAPSEDQFKEVREFMSGSRIVGPPKGGFGRAARKVRRSLFGHRDARDLFQRAGVGVLFPITVCESPGIPYVYWLSDFQCRRMPDLFPSPIRHAIERDFDNNVQAATRVVLSSEDSYKDFAEYYPQHLWKARVLRFCSVPDESWWRLSSAEVACARSISTPYVIVCNQFTGHKNHDVLLGAMRILKERGSNISLVCTGSTYDFRGLNYYERVSTFMNAHHLQSTVHILGVLPRDEQMALIRGSAAVLQPSRFEGWSTINEDAKSLGRPVLASDIAVHREQLHDYYSASFLPLDEPEAWAAAIDAVVSEETTQTMLDAETVARRAKAVASTARVFIGIMREAMRL